MIPVLELLVDALGSEAHFELATFATSCFFVARLHKYTY
jgi:hypothetical protein